MKQEIMGEDVPCPTLYGDEQKKGPADAANKMPTFAFHSSSKQRPKAHNSDVPAPGTYVPSYDGVNPKVRGMAYARSKSPQFHDQGSFTHAPKIMSTDGHVGPGTYRPDYLISGGRATISSRVQRSASFGRSAAFRMSTVRDLTSKYFNEPYFC